MADIALSTSSPLASLLAMTPADPNSAGTPTNADPFAALFATVAKTPGIALPGKAKSVDMPIISVATEPTVAQDAMVAKAPSDGHAGDTIDSDTDPLADAIASGPLAVLALAPTITPPVALAAAIAAQPAATPSSGSMPAMVTAPIRMSATTAALTPAGTPVPFDARPAVPRKLPLFPAVTPSGRALPASAAAPRADPAAATPPATDDAPVMQATPDGAGTDRNQQQPAAAAATAAISILPDDVAKAVLASLNGTSAASGAPEVATIVPPQPSTPLETDPAPAQPAIQGISVQQAASVAVPPATRRTAATDVATPIRADREPRKRGDGVVPETPPIAFTQRATETPRAAAADATTALVEGKGDAVVQQVLTIGRDNAWLDSLARDIAKTAGTGNDLHFRLNPQHLGALSVAIAQSDDGASIRLTADTETTRTLLQDAQPKLIAEARAQGLKVSETQVDLKDHRDQQSGNQDNNRWPQGGSGQNATAQNGQNRQSSPAHQPFVSNLERKAEADSESPERDSDALYA